jgi:hypothetical protein
MSPTNKMLFSNVLHTLRNSTPTGRRSPIVFRHMDIELELLAEKVRTRLIPWSDAWQVLDKSMPFDLARPRSAVESISVDSLFKLVVQGVPYHDRDAVLVRVSGQLAGLRIGPCEALDFIAEGYFVEKEREED